MAFGRRGPYGSGPARASTGPFLSARIGRGTKCVRRQQCREQSRADGTDRAAGGKNSAHARGALPRGVELALTCRDGAWLVMPEAITTRQLLLPSLQGESGSGRQRTPTRRRRLVVYGFDQPRGPRRARAAPLSALSSSQSATPRGNSPPSMPLSDSCCRVAVAGRWWRCPPSVHDWPPWPLCARPLGCRGGGWRARGRRGGWA